MNNQITVLILCGGQGNRLWPLSHSELPKQFAPILLGQTLFERTIERNRELAEHIVVAVNSKHSHFASDQLSALNVNNYSAIIEPVGRNTAPALTLAALAESPDVIMLVVPSDQIIDDIENYKKAVQKAAQLAREGRIVTFGIQPRYPETGYGYIEVESGAKAGRVLSFKEKPSLDLATEYLKQGNYFWNSGMFCFQVSTFLNELQKHAGDVYDACCTAYKKYKSTKQGSSPSAQEQWQIDENDMLAIPSISVDYAVMEHSDRVAMVPCIFDWSDLGSFDSLNSYYQNIASEAGFGQSSDFPVFQTEEGNINIAQKPPVYIDSHNNMVISNSSDRRVALIDASDLMVVDTPHALLICKKQSGQKVKQIAEILQNSEGS